MIFALVCPCVYMQYLLGDGVLYSSFIVIAIYLFFYVAFNSQGHIAMDSLWVEEPVHTSWSRFCTVNHRALASNYQFSNMKCPG